jgi:hypothetical protein
MSECSCRSPEVHQNLRTVSIEHEEIIQLRKSLEPKSNELIKKGLLDCSTGQNITDSQINQVPSEKTAETISKLSARLDLAISLSAQCDALQKDLNRPDTPAVDRPLGSLDELVGTLERCRDDLDRELRVRAKRAKIFDDLLQDIRSLGPEKATSFVDEIDPDQWISLLEAMEDMEPSCSIEGREARKASTDVLIPVRDVAPLIFNRVAGKSIRQVPYALTSIRRLLHATDECASDILCLQHITRPLLFEVARECPEASSQVVAVLLLDAIAYGEPANWQWIENAAHINTVRSEIAIHSDINNAV